MSKFTGIHMLVLYFPSNFGDDVTRIEYIGLKGEHKEMKRDTIITVYELNANPKDHKTDTQNFVSKSIQ